MIPACLRSGRFQDHCSTASDTPKQRILSTTDGFLHCITILHYTFYHPQSLQSAPLLHCSRFCLCLANYTKLKFCDIRLIQVRWGGYPKWQPPSRKHAYILSLKSVLIFRIFQSRLTIQHLCRSLNIYKYNRDSDSDNLTTNFYFDILKRA